MNRPISIERDFKSLSCQHHKRKRHPRRRLFIGAISVAAIISLVIIAPTIATATRAMLPQNNPEQKQLSADVSTVADILTEPHESLTAIDASQKPLKWHISTVRNGDSLSTIFDRIGLPPSQTYSLMNLGKDTLALTKIKPGDILKIRTGKDNRHLYGLSYAIDETHQLKIAYNQDGLFSQITETPLEVHITHTSGTIQTSLFLAAQQSGMSDNLTMELANLFGWDVDFALDIRSGDQFHLIYEELFLHGKKLRDGKILAAEFINQNKSYRAILYTNSDNHSAYYSPDGKSIRKAFLRSPVDFKRISSRFNPRRKHPVLNRIRAHKGVDYAAKRGTPIRATGDGKVILRGTKGGYGRTVIIQHGSTYNTLYAHMNSYARGIRSGKKVKQGQIIGFVGSSGLATGPHLHYEFRVNGVHRNPLTVHLPDAAPLAKKYMPAFRSSSLAMQAQLDMLKYTSLTLNNRP